MAQKGPERYYRKEISLFELTRQFPDERSATEWFESVFWAKGRTCPRCEGCNTYATKGNGNQMPYRCRDCKRYFSVRMGTVMESSNLPLQKWVWAIFLEITSLKGVSSMKLHRDLEIRQATAWHILHRIREGSLSEIIEFFEGQVDEAYLGGLEKNKHEDKKLNARGRGTVGKTTVVGVKDCKTNKIRAEVIPDTTKPIVQQIVNNTRSADAMVYTDEHLSYEGLTNRTSVNHSQKQWIVSTVLRDLANTNGIESFWVALKHVYRGMYHHLSKKYLTRYVTQFAGKHNLRDHDTIDQMAVVVQGMIGKRLRYKDLVA